MLKPIPLIQAGAGGALAVVGAQLEEARALLATALGAHPLLPAVARIGDAVSRSWLRHQGSSYRGEIEAVAAIIGRPGVRFLNLVYEFACSTSAAPDPADGGNRMIRVLDWGMHGIGRFVVVAEHEAEAGQWFDVTWPGYVGVLTAIAPGRFAAAINQAPRLVATGVRPLDEVLGRALLVGARGTVPASHLLRRVFETAADFAGALAMLSDETVKLTKPAIFTLCGSVPGECAAIDAMGSARRVRRSDAVAVANDWSNSAWPGVPRLHAAVAMEGETPRSNNEARRDQIAAAQQTRFRGAVDLCPPVLNRHTVLVAVMNPATGGLRVEALDFAAPGDLLPSVAAGPLEIPAVQRRVESVRPTASFHPA